MRIIPHIFTGTMRLHVTKDSDFFSVRAFPRTAGDGKWTFCWAHPKGQKAESKRMTIGEIRKPLPLQKFILGYMGKFSSADIPY